jgi:hypothetical protein
MNDRLSDDARRTARWLLGVIRDELARQHNPKAEKQKLKQKREEQEDRMFAWGVKRDVAKLAATLGSRKRAWDELAPKYGRNSGAALRRACQPNRVHRRSRGKGGQK